MRIKDLVGSLLIHNNCVVIPNLGGFIARPHEASVNYKNRIAHPPSKKLTFNSSLKNNDGLLVTSFAEKQNLSYNDALSEVNTFSADCLNRIKEGKKVVFPKVGFLFSSAEGKIAFEQDRDFNLLLNAFGLGSVDFVPVKTKPKVSDEKEEKIIPLDRNDGRSKKRAYIKYIAAAALVPFLFYSFWIPMKTDVLQSRVLYSTDFNPFSSQQESSYQKASLEIEKKTVAVETNTLEKIIENLPDDVDVISYPLSEDVYVPVRIQKNNTTPSVTTSASKDLSFHVIGGCFSKKKNAEKLIETMKNKGFDAFIVDKNKGLHRVSVVQLKNKKEAVKQKAILKDKGFASWILKK